MQNISEATSYDTAIEIISAKEVQEGIGYLKDRSRKISHRVIVPIEKGGHVVGQDLSRPGFNEYLIPTSMRMSHRSPTGEYLPIPRLVYAPSIKSIIDTHKRSTRKVVFAEAVVETEQTIIASIGIINELVEKFNADNQSHFPLPEYHTLALIDKISGVSSIPNLTSAFKVDKMIWVAGCGCDDGEQGRELKNFVGRLADGCKVIPPRPYYTRNF